MPFERLPYEMNFTRHKFLITKDSGSSGDKSISHGKPYKVHLVMLNTLRKVEDHEIHVRCEHNCSQHG